ncbi:MAG: Gldg family protein [Gammaproteobacteria bacterium]|nr:Gldg family protein [Gammaproteobacteria bacterium]
MNRRIYPRLALALLALGFVSFMALNNLLFGGLRVDLTESRMYTVSAGTREIIDSIEEPIDLYFFFSDKATRDVAPLRSYARRVRELLEEYALRADGRIRLQVIDPVAFSEAEDQAAEFGLQAVPLDAGGEQVYFGLAGSNAWGEHQVIPFFQPEREEFLEYELSKMLAGLVAAKKPVVGVVSGLQINGGFDMMTSQPTPPWVVMEQLQQGFEVRSLPLTGDAIEEDVTTLMVVHPAGLPDSMQYAIDQFVLKGGKAIVYVDPYCESSRASGNPMLEPGAPESSSSLPRLFNAWGVEFAPDKVVGDAATALQISVAADQPPVAHLGFLGLGVEQISPEDVVTGSLESINLGMAGALAPAAGASTHFEPLLQSSAQSALLEAMQVQMNRDPAALLKGFAPTGERYTLAARIGGPAKSAFDGPQVEGREHVGEAQDINVIVVADADLLADRFWVQVQDFFGQRTATAWADNAAFAQNALENLSGSSALIGIRSRGRYSRPFELVQRIRLGADAKYRESAELLQQRLDETEQQLAELQRNRQESNQLALSPEQEQALARFQDEKLRIRKQLREVRLKLDQDIERLGMALKVLNIVVMPLVLTLALFGWHRWRMRRRRAADQR